MLGWFSPDQGLFLQLLKVKVLHRRYMYVVEGQRRVGRFISAVTHPVQRE